MNEEEILKLFQKLFRLLFKETVIRYKEKYIPKLTINHPIFIQGLSYIHSKVSDTLYYAKLQIIVIFLNHIVQIYLFAT